MSPRIAGVRENRYQPAWWLRNAHAQTLWGRFVRRIPRVPTTRECLRTPDGDNLELHHLAAPSGAPRVLLLHGLEGSRDSHYVGGLLAQAQRRGWGATLLVFRGCGPEPNLARRFYHSGETEDLAFAFETLRARWSRAPWLLAGVSLGGNVLLNWLGTRQRGGSPVRAAAAVSVPFDLEAGARYISRGFARVYDRSFVRSLRRKARQKLSRYPGLYDRQALERARTIYAFDDAVTAPVHGFRDARDYYERSSSITVLERIRIPTLLLSAADDPFLPVDVLARVARIATTSPALTVEFHEHGGHAGFVGGRWPWRPLYYAEARVFGHFDQAMEGASEKSYD